MSYIAWEYMGSIIRVVSHARPSAHAMWTGPDLAPKLPQAPTPAENRHLAGLRKLPRSGGGEDRPYPVIKTGGGGKGARGRGRTMRAAG